jgi:hypothetical protein
MAREDHRRDPSDSGESKAEADRKHREAMAESNARLGVHEKRDQPTSERRKSGTVNAVTGERYWTR